MPVAYPLAVRLLRALGPEAAHRLSIAALRAGLVPKTPSAPDPVLATRVWGLDLANPIGLAAGFDKNAEAVDALLDLGFGFVEVGTVTPRPQAGNPRPRLFRLPAASAVINRMGFNNRGLDYVRARLARRRRGQRSGLVGANVGPNRDAVDPAADCAAGIRALAPLADYLVVNISSPNTSGLRTLQDKARLRPLLFAALDARVRSGSRPPLLIKIAPDLTGQDRRDIAEAVLESGIDGLIATNTTIRRPGGLIDRYRDEPGGLSGRPLFEPSTVVLADMYGLTGGRIPLIAAGGVGSGADAYAKIKAGASLVQLYTALVYGGPRLVADILRDLAARLRAEGFASVAEAVGTGVPEWTASRAGTAP